MPLTVLSPHFARGMTRPMGRKVSKSPKEETRAVLVLGKLENGEWQVIVRCQQLNASHCFASTFCRSYDTAYGAKNV